MPCIHLVKLYHLCEQEGIKLASSDLIHVFCPKCGEKEVCPDVLTDEYDALAQENSTTTADDDRLRGEHVARKI